MTTELEYVVTKIKIERENEEKLKHYPILKEQLRIAVEALKNIIKEDMYNLDEHRVFIEETLKQIKDLENAK